jgi:uncharacterized membrane protein (UPF0127 family)
VDNLRLVNESNGELIASQVNKAYSFPKRFKGLMFTKMPQSGTALHIKPCQSIHTFFMNYAIDIIYLDETNTIVGLTEALQPRRVGMIYKKTSSVIELPDGVIKKNNLKVGQVLKFI